MRKFNHSRLWGNIVGSQRARWLRREASAAARALFGPAARRPLRVLLAALATATVLSLLLGGGNKTDDPVLPDFWSIPERSVETWRDLASRCPSGQPVALKYEVAGGAIDQYLAHIAAFTLAREMRAQVIIPKSKFANFTAVQVQNEVQWLDMPTSKLLQVERIKELWAELGVRVYTSTPRALRAASHPALDRPDRARTAAYAGGSGVGLNDAARGGCEAVEAALRDAAYPSVAEGSLRPVVLDLGDPLMMLRVKSEKESRLAIEAMRRLPFAERLTSLARLAASRAIELGVESYGGVHLDASGESDYTKGHDASSPGGRVGWGSSRGDRLGEYREYLDLGPFSKDDSLYVVSQLLETIREGWGTGEGTGTAAAGPRRAGIDRAVKAFRDVCEQVLYSYSKRVLHLGVLLTDTEVQGLELEQLAIVDLLMLVPAKKFLGHSRSLFSVFAAEIRTLSGDDPADSLLIAQRGGDAAKLMEATVMLSGRNKIGRP